MELRGLREVKVEVTQVGALLRQVLQHLKEERERGMLRALSTSFTEFFGNLQQALNEL